MKMNWKNVGNTALEILIITIIILTITNNIPSNFNSNYYLFDSKKFANLQCNFVKSNHSAAVKN